MTKVPWILTNTLLCKSTGSCAQVEQIVRQLYEKVVQLVSTSPIKIIVDIAVKSCSRQLPVICRHAIVNQE
jgi:hypothetical protein